MRKTCVRFFVSEVFTDINFFFVSENGSNYRYFLQAKTLLPTYPIVLIAHTVIQTDVAVFKVTPEFNVTPAFGTELFVKLLLNVKDER